MSSLRLYHAPGACSRVTLNALEELGLAFEDHPLALLRGEQKLPGYLAVNPMGKVPALCVGDRILTENPAILYYLASQYPASGLLPGMDEPVRAAQSLADLVWFGGTLHPLVRQLAMPQSFTAGEPADVQRVAQQAFRTMAETLDRRVSGGQWWYGDTWSIIDVYLSWIVGMAKLGGWAAVPATDLVAHTDRVRARPSFQRALAREQAAMDRHAIPLPPGVRL